MVIMMKDDEKAQNSDDVTASQPADSADKPAEKPTERGGPKGPEPTRFGDWESGGRCTDF